MATAVTEGSAMARLYDMHCHLSFAKGGVAGWGGADDPRIFALSGTVTPAEYVTKSDWRSNVHFGMGFHPHWVASGECNFSSALEFLHYLPVARYVSEIGLDFGKKCEVSYGEQLRYFDMIIEQCRYKLLSVHAVHSASQVLDTLEEHDAFSTNTVIFHWFSGTSDELQRAIKDGAYFSVGPLMLNSKRGREYAKAIPLDKLLLETDFPYEQGEEFTVDDHVKALEDALVRIAELRNMDPVELREKLAENSEGILALSDEF